MACVNKVNTNLVLFTSCWLDKNTTCTETARTGEIHRLPVQNVQNSYQCERPPLKYVQTRVYWNPYAGTRTCTLVLIAYSFTSSVPRSFVRHDISESLSLELLVSRRDWN